LARMAVAERRDRLVDAALAVMARGGVPSATTRAIVAEAGMQIGVFHYCFRSKDELLLEVMKRIGERSFGAVGEVLTRTSDPAELIRLAADAYWQHINENPLEHLLSYELTHFALRQPGAEDAAQAQYDGYLDGMAGLLTALAEAGSFSWRSSVDVLARMVLATVEGITFQWLVHRDAERGEELFGKLAEWLYAEAGLRAAA